MGAMMSLRERSRAASLSTTPGAASAHLLGDGAAQGHTEQHMFGFWVAVSFTVNYVIGAGLLGLPEAFFKAGLVLSAVVVLLFAYLLNITKDWMVETGARAEALFKADQIASRRLLGGGSAGHVQLPLEDEAAAGHEGAALLRDGSGQLGVAPASDDYLIHSARKFEVTDLFAMFIGPKSPVVYAFVISLYLYGSLWAYTAVFAKSFAENVPTGIGGSAACDVNSPCEWPMRVWMLLFAIIVVPLTCRDLKEQVIVQVIMFLARILVVLLLCATVLGSHACPSGVVFAEVAPGTSRVSDVPLADASGLSTIIPVGIFAFIFHHSTPVLAQPIKNKRSVNRVFAAALLICCLAYCAMGLVVGSYFGPLVQSQCNLNWRNYVGCLAPPPGYSLGGGGAGNGTCTSPSTWVTREGGPSPLCVNVGDRPVYATIIRYIVVLFPALDVLSAFPLNAITLGNNLMSAVLGESAVLAPTAEEEVLAGHLERALASENHTAGMGAAAAESFAAPAPRGCCGGRCRGREVGVPGSGGALSFLMSFVVKPAKTLLPPGAELPAGLAGSAATTAAASSAAADISRLSIDSPSVFASARGSVSSCSAGSSPRSGGGAADGGEEGIGLIQLPAAAAARLAAGTQQPIAARQAAAAERDEQEAAADAAQALLDSPAALAILAKPWYVRTRRGHAVTKTLYRLFAAVPPIIGALFVSDLGNILQVTGLVGVAIAFTIPASLRLASFAKTRAVFTFLTRLGAANATKADLGASAAPAAHSHSAHLPSVLPSVASLEAHCPATLPPLEPVLNGTATAAAAEASLAAYADYAAKATTPSWREMLLKVPGAEAVLKTPYTSAWARGRVIEAFFVASLAMMGYVMFDVVQAITSG